MLVNGLLLVAIHLHNMTKILWKAMQVFGYYYSLKYHLLCSILTGLE